MIKNAGILLIEFTFIVFLGLILVIAFTGGFSFSLGVFSLKAHSFKTPVIVLVSTLVLRKFLTGSFFHKFLLLTYVRQFGTKILNFADELVGIRVFGRILRESRFWNIEIQNILLILIFFISSRILYVYAGGRFDSAPLDFFWQYLDPALLRENLVESLVYLHAQPPLFNLFLGIWLKLFGESAYYGFWGTFVMLSLAVYVSMYLLLLGFGISSKVSLALTTFYMVSPTAIGYENWLFYTWPVAVLLLVSALSLRKYLDRGTISQGFVFFSLICAVALIRSAFHLIWLIVVLLGLLIIRASLWKRTLAGAALPILIVLAVYAKNYLLFSSFSASSWMWLNLSKMTVLALPEAEKAVLLKAGILSPAVQRDAFDSPEEYAEVLSPPPPFGIEVLDQFHKSTGAVNMNHRIYLALSELRKREDLYVLKNYPAVYGRSVLDALLIFTEPATYFVRQNISKIEIFEKIYNVILYGQIPWFTSNTRINMGDNSKGAYNVYLEDIGFLVIFGFVGVTLSGMICLSRCLKKACMSTADAVYLYIWMTIIYVVITASLFEIGENYRFRVMIEPLLFVSVVVGVSRSFVWIRRRNLMTRTS